MCPLQQGGEEGRGEAEGRRVLLRPEPAVPEELVEVAAGTRSRWVERALPPRAGADDFADYLLNSVIDERYPEEKRLRETKTAAEKTAALRIREELLEVEHRQ